jgi:PAS domain S-box-containing protein
MEAKTFDVIVSDYIMPGKDGLEFLRELRASGNSIPFIVFTGKGMEIVAIKALNLGADQYVNKIGNPETVYSELAHGIRTVVKGKKAEEEVRKSEAKYRGLVENIGNGIAIIDLEGRFGFVNQALCKMIGYSEKELIGRPFADFLHPDDKKMILQIFLDSWKNPGRKGSLEFRVIHKKGHTIHMHSSPTATRYKNKIIGFNAILSDITKLKLAERALQQSEERHRSMVEQAPDSIMIFDLNGVVKSCNSAAVAMSGYPKDDVVGKHFSELKALREAEAKKFLKLLYSLSKGVMPEPFEIVYLKENGTSAFGEVHISLIKEEERVTSCQAIIRDITERKCMEKALQESEERFRQVAENSGEWIWEVDTNGLYTYASPIVEKIVGYKPEELVGKKHFYDLFLPEGREDLKAAAFQAFAKKSPFHEFLNRIIHKNGNTVWLSTSGVPIVYNEGPLLDTAVQIKTSLNGKIPWMRFGRAKENIDC